MRKRHGKIRWMNGERNLGKLLRTLAPVLLVDRYVVATLEGWPHTPPKGLLATIQEPEGLTAVMPVGEAEHLGIDRTLKYRCIRLNVHSSLEAVGLTAAVSSRLARHGISANMLAGAYHDHVLIPECDGERALQALEELSGEAGPFLDESRSPNPSDLYRFEKTGGGSSH